MRVNGKQIIATLFLLLGMHSVMAGTLDTVSVAVENRTPEEEARALGEALEQLLVRLSGKPSVLDMPVAAEAAEQQGRWVLRQDYRDGQLVVRFDTAGLMDFLSSRGAPVWGVPRPRILVTLNYNTEPGIELAPGARMTFFGRLN